MARKYNVVIEEVVSENFTIEADNIHEALKIEEQGYKNGKFVLCPGHLIAKQISANDEKGNYVEWYEF